MISFIIFEANDNMKDLYIKVLKKYLYTAHDYYKIHVFNCYNSLIWKDVLKLEGVRIYIINTKIPGIDGYDLARKIRYHGDFISPIIMIAPKRSKNGIRRGKNAMIQNEIVQNKDLIKELFESVDYGYQMVTTNSSLSFSIYDEIYRLPYNDIYYIDKNYASNSLTIHTKDDTYEYYLAMKKMYKRLEYDSRFMMCHRSCIINLNKVSLYDSKNNIIMFDNGLCTDLISRSGRDELLSRISPHYHSYFK